MKFISFNSIFVPALVIFHLISVEDVFDVYSNEFDEPSTLRYIADVAISGAMIGWLVSIGLSKFISFRYIEVYPFHIVRVRRVAILYMVLVIMLIVYLNRDGILLLDHDARFAGAVAIKLSVLLYIVILGYLFSISLQLVGGKPYYVGAIACIYTLMLVAPGYRSPIVTLWGMISLSGIVININMGK